MTDELTARRNEIIRLIPDSVLRDIIFESGETSSSFLSNIGKYIDYFKNTLYLVTLITYKKFVSYKAWFEELDAEDAEARAVSGLSKGVGHGLGHLARTLEGGLAHGHGLPGFDVVTALLAVSNRSAEARRDVARSCVPGTHGEQRDLVVEVDTLFDNDDAGRRTRVFLGVGPGGGGLLGSGHAGLTKAG